MCTSQLIHSNVRHDQKYGVFHYLKVGYFKEFKKMAAFPMDGFENGFILHGCIL